MKKKYKNKIVKKNKLVTEFISKLFKKWAGHIIKFSKNLIIKSNKNFSFNK